jgi:hypothetical protein
VIAMMTATKRAWRRVKVELFDRDGLSTVFLHARNLLTGAAVVAAGLYAVHHLGNKQLAGMWTVHVAGYGVALGGTLLLVLNLFDGLRRLARQQLPLALRVAVAIAYTGMSLRLVQVLVYFRYAA